MTAADSHLNLLLSEYLNQLVLIEALSIPSPKAASRFSNLKGYFTLLASVSLYAFRWVFFPPLLLYGQRGVSEIAVKWLFITSLYLQLDPFDLRK